MAEPDDSWMLLIRPLSSTISSAVPIGLARLLGRTGELAAALAGS
jgi:hypothetical protein